MHIHQINLQPSVGGGEVYTRWFTRAMADAGAKVTLYVNPANKFWAGLDSAKVAVAAVSSPGEIADRLPVRRSLIVTQSRIPEDLIALAARNHVLTGFAHMPMLGRSASEFARYSTVFTVSNYCIALLRQAGISQVYPDPLYGTYALDRDGVPASQARGPIRAESPYHWDKRKGRDRLMSIFEPLIRAISTPRTFERKSGLTLGIVSLLSPIKQFPALFSLLAPRIARLPGVNIEIFGDGGYAQVRDLKRSLTPVANRVRFWGYQQAVRSIYPNIDYLVTGLPEKEALGLNVLEAQALGTPALAPRSPPFTETIEHEQSGFLYRDPREDGGEDFEELLRSLLDGRARPDPRVATEHLAKFSYEAMIDRARGVLEYFKQMHSGIDPE